MPQMHGWTPFGKCFAPFARVRKVQAFYMLPNVQKTSVYTVAELHVWDGNCVNAVSLTLDRSAFLYDLLPFHITLLASTTYTAARKGETTALQTPDRWIVGQSPLM